MSHSILGAIFSATAMSFRTFFLWLPLILIAAVVIAVLRRISNRDNSAGDTEVIQQLFKGMEQLEKRVESLETILLDRKQRDSSEKRETIDVK